jgi:MFS family permease
MAVSVGAIFWLAFGLYLKPMVAEFGWSRTEFASVYSIATIANVVMFPVAGWLVDRFGPTLVILVGIVSLSASYASLSLVSSYATFVALAVAVAATGSLATYPSYLALPPRWFDRHLGIALAVASTGIGVGALVLPQVVTASLESVGWRLTFVLVGLIALVVGIASFAAFIRDNKGPIPKNEVRESSAPDQRWDTKAGVPFGEAVRTFDFWAFSAGFSLVFFVTMGINFHFAALIADRGNSPADAATGVATLAMASLAGRLVTGLLLHKLSYRVLAVVFFIGQAAGCLVLLTGTTAAVYLGAALLGLAQGAELDMMPFVIARRFGRMAYARIYGSSFSVLQVGQMASPVVLAWTFDRTGSYTVGLTVYPFLSLVAAVLVCVARTQTAYPAGPWQCPQGAANLLGNCPFCAKWLSF